MAAATAVICKPGLEVDYLGARFVVATEPFGTDSSPDDVVVLRADDGRELYTWVTDLKALDGSPVL